MRPIINTEKPIWKAYRHLGRTLIGRYATLRLAASSEAAAGLFGLGWRSKENTQLFYCGIDLERFGFQQEKAASVRANLGIPETATVIGHVGRFENVKNHAFLLRIAKAACNLDRNVLFLLVGRGSLREQMRAEAAALGLSSRVIFCDPRPDVPDIMMYCLDALALPSLYEGLPLVVLEAQAANLPVLVSDAVTSECVVAPDLVEFASLGASPAYWASSLLAKATKTRRECARNVLRGTPFDIRYSVKALATLYSSINQ